MMLSSNCRRTIGLLNSRFLISNLKPKSQLVNKFSTSTINPTDENKKKELSKQQTDTKDVDLNEEDENVDSKDLEKPKEKERYAVNTYPNNPPGLMEFFDDPKNWLEDFVRSGRPWKVEELRIKSNSDLHKLWYVLLKEKNMLLTMQEAYNEECEILPSEERIFKVNESMKNLEQVIRERNKAYWQLEIDQNETGERPVAFRKDIYGRYRWITCSEHFMPMPMNTKWKLFNGPGGGKNVYEFMRRYKEKRMTKKMSLLLQQAFEVRQLLRRFPNMDMEALEEKYPEIDVEAQKLRMETDKKFKRIIGGFFGPGVLP